MDVKKSKLNISVSVIFKVITILMSVVVKVMLIKACGNEVNGLNALYLSIVGFLSVAELGVSAAITFCMYKPIVEGDNDRVSALFYLFRKLYFGIGGIIFLLGLIITPFLNYFAKDYRDINQNLYITFILVLTSVVITYAYGAESALIGAYKDNYIVTVISQGGIIFQYILQIAVLLLTKSFIYYLICRIITSVAQWLVTVFVSYKKHTLVIKNKNRTIDDDTKITLKKSIKAMFMHKIGHVLVNTVDSVVISVFIGVVALAQYSNYIAILTSMTGVIALVFSSLTSIFGHLCVEESTEVSKKHCDSFHLVNFIIAAVFFLGYYAVIDSLIAIIFSPDLIIQKSVCLVITLNSFIQFMRQNTLTFRDATGTFYNDRWKPLIEGVFNLILSIALVNVIGVAGVIVATIITNLLICHIVEPYVLYKNAFKVSPKGYYLRNYSMILLFSLALLVLDRCMLRNSNELLRLVGNGFISVGISAILFVVTVIVFRKNAKYLIAIWRNK